MSAPRLLLGDRYEVGEQIGRGGMADVHRAHDTVLERSVAVKMLRDVGAVDVRRFADEARLLSALDHANIVTLLDAGVAEERPWIALELVEGITLSEEMAAGVLDESRARQVGQHMAAALAHAHDRGVVHRDVKPSNILIAADGTAKLTDFGIARLDDASAGITLTGHTVGTAAYLSPEQVRGEPVSGAGDVYALGLMLLEALTAVRAYPGPPLEAALARLHQSPLIPTSLPPGWPGLLAAMTAQDAGERPTAVQVQQRLAPDHAAAVEDGDPTTTVAVPMSPARHRRPGLAVAVAILLLAGSLALARGFAGDSPAVAEATSAPTAAASSTAATPKRTPTPSAATLAASEREKSAPKQVKQTAPDTSTAGNKKKTKKKDKARGPGQGKGQGKKKAKGEKPKKDKGPKQKGPKPTKPKKAKGKK